MFSIPQKHFPKNSAFYKNYFTSDISSIYHRSSKTCKHRFTINLQGSFSMKKRPSFWKKSRGIPCEQRQLVRSQLHLKFQLPFPYSENYSKNLNFSTITYTHNFWNSWPQKITIVNFFYKPIICLIFMIKKRPLISLKVKQWSTYDQL